MAKLVRATAVTARHQQRDREPPSICAGLAARRSLMKGGQLPPL